MKTRAQQEAREGGAQEEKEVEAGVPVWVEQAQARDMRAQLRGVKFILALLVQKKVQMLTPEPTSLESCGYALVLGLLALLVQTYKY